MIYWNITTAIISTVWSTFTFDTTSRWAFAESLFCYLLTMLTLIYAYCTISRWKREELTHLGYAWKWSKDGLFVIFACLITVQIIAEILAYTCRSENINNSHIELYLGFYCLDLVMNWILNLSILVMTIKMSRARWSDQSDHEE